MFSYAAGSLFIILGIIFFHYPEALRTRLKKKAMRRIRAYFFVGAFTIGVLLISTGWQYEGLLPKILVIVGIVAILKGLFFLKSKAADKAAEWILKQPVLFFKIFAFCQVLLGLVIIFALKK